MKTINHTWDFSGANTKYYTHGIHSYPAMMIPQVAHRIIEEHGKNAETAYDPFCGSGSVLLEFKTAGIECYGSDLNPLAILISKAKTTPIATEKIEKAFQKISQRIKEIENKPCEEPNFSKIDFWFKKKPIKDLAIIKLAIDELEETTLKNFFLVCFSETVRKSSNTRGGEFKLYRLGEKDLAKYNPKANEIFGKIYQRNVAGMNELNNLTKQKELPSVTVLEADVSKKVPIEPKSIDLIVSSPPYGDSRTTVAYGQFSRLSMQWLGINHNKNTDVDKNSLGGKPQKENLVEHSTNLEKAISKISKEDEKRAQDVISFFNDFYLAAQNIEKVMKENSTIAWVVGNRTVKGIKIPTDQILVDMFRDLNYTHDKTIIRSIPSKRMPRSNSPTNKKGVLSPTMNEEYIIILKR
ncbi:MAG: DNA adenine methylase [Candidatus Diapherotrites archaeon]|nr:DNA adenine methylase [Candidatus Diapherotrites archaeon]